MSLTFKDMFCGAGGSTEGAVAAGATPVMGMNHWERAGETYQTNHPQADFARADISASDPRRYPSTDILLASPECTNHSLAKGARRRKPQAASLWDDGPAGDAEQDRSRATMWDVVRFAEAHHYKAIIVENVVDAMRWGPGDDGSLFRAWLAALEALGYEHEAVMLNSMFAGLVPQSRDRMYVVFWRKGMRRPDLDLRPVSWCPGCERVVRGKQTFKANSLRQRGRWGRYGAQYVYTCPECPAQVVYPGAVPAAAAIDFTLPIGLIGERARPLATSTRERIRNGLERLASEPFALRLLQGGVPRPLTLPVVTQTTRHDMGMVMPVAGNTHESTPGNRARDVTLRPMDTVHATLDRALVVPPNTNGNARDAFTVPGPTQVTETRASLVLANRAHAVPRPACLEPAPTATTAPAGCGIGLVELQQNGGVRDASAASAHTVRAGGQHHGVIVEHYTPGRAKDPNVSPAGPITSRDHHSLVVPYRQGIPRNADVDAMHTLGTVESAALTQGRAALRVTDEDIDACRFRMFELHEIAATMAFPDGYEVVGNKRERMRQYGNAVTPPAMTFLMGRVIDAMDAERGAA